MKLRIYQSDAVTNVRASFAKGHKRVMLYAPTGAGKTVIASEIMRLAEEKGKKVSFVVNRVTLVRQASKHLRKLGMVHGIVQGDNTWGTDRGILVCSIQTLARRGYPESNLVIIDEAHGCTSPTYRKMIEHYSGLGVPIIGLSATPFTKGLGRDYGFGELFEDLIVSATIPELIKHDPPYLIDCEIYSPSIESLVYVPIVNGDYDQIEIAKILDTPRLIGDIVNQWVALCAGQSTVLFATNILHSKHCCEEFNNRGIVAEHVDCYTDDDERDAMFERFDSGATTVLCNVDVLSEGWDCPRAAVMVLARKTRTLKRYIQRAGRVLRPYPGKTMALILDHSTTSRELGYPTDELPLFLDKGKPPSKSEKKEKEDRLPKACPKCSFLIPAGTHPCPKCGFAMQAQNKIQSGEGTLTKLEKKYLFSRDQLQEFWSGCLGMADLRKKQRGWAAHLFYDITHQWPKNLQEIACNPCVKVVSYEKYKRIKFAKSKRNGQ